MKQKLRLGNCYVLAKHKFKQLTIRHLSLLAIATTMCLYARAQRPEPSGPVLSGIDTTSTTRDTIEIEEVEVNTGYQRMPKERTTGSFVLIDSATYHRSISPNILERLDGVASGLILNKGLPSGGNNAFVSIRGRSTIFGNADPLIVIDGFPFEGDISQINAADVASVSILRDAAAASIWGTRSGNGVLVITTRKGNFNQPVKVEAGFVASLANRPDLHYQEQLSAPQYLELEKSLFDVGYYNTTINRDYRPISESVDILAKLRNGEITQTEADAHFAEYALRDIRTETEELLYRPQLHQQYRLQFSGGGAAHTFFISGSYNRLTEHLKTTKNARGTVSARQTMKLFHDRLDISTGFDYAFTNDRFGGAGSYYRPYTPYDRLRDENGRHLPVVADLRLGYADTAGSGQLLDWHYRPLDEVNPDYGQHHGQVRMQLSSSFTLLPFLNLMGAYQYLNGTTVSERLNDMKRYYTRNLINQYSYFDGSELIRPIPEGSIAQQRNQLANTHIYRFQLQLEKQFHKMHRVNAILGYEANDTRVNNTSQMLYGYDPETKLNGNAMINPMQEYRYYYSTSASRITTAASADELVNTSRSYYGNVAYSLMDRYDVSGSLRRDESNLFGVKSNQRGVPLWSAGLAWHLDKEGFFRVGWLPKLKLRLTYGYNGNVDRSLSAYLTIRAFNVNDASSMWGEPLGEIRNPPNPSLRWERVQSWNAGLDFSISHQILSGSVDVYRKVGKDLIGNSPIAPQTGIITFRGNNSNTRTDGLDISLNSQNINNAINWRTNLLFSYSYEKITHYSARQSRNSDILLNNFVNPLEGYPYYAIFSLPSAGLGNSGDPQGYLDGEISTNYSGILGQANPGELTFHGSASPLMFGNLRNTFSYQGLEFSFNISFKLNYYFRQARVFNGSEYGYDYSGYGDRWQQPGDEVNTFIPALRYPINANRATFFNYSEHLVHRGDHVRLQDIRLSWTINHEILKRSGIKNILLYTHATRFGTLWQLNRIDRLDPDYPTAAYRDPLQLSFGLNLTL